MYSTTTGVGETDEEILRLLKTDVKTGYVDTVDDYNYYYSYFPTTDWGLLLKKDVGYYTREKSSLAGAMLVIFIFSNVLMLCLMNFVSRNLALPIRQLKEKLEHQKLNAAVSLDVVTDNDEITMLSGTIENIVNQIVVQNQNLIAAKDLALKAHMNAMEAQMNPHFLYNSLSVIGTYGLEKGDMVIPQMCNELSSLLRYSINYNQKEVRLADEINNIKSYLYIMKMRYEHLLNYSWELDPVIERELVPKLILQPLVENCFQHGFKNISPGWEIKIRSWCEAGYWFLSVANTGVSLDEKRIELLYQAVEAFKKSPIAEASLKGFEDGKGLGLKNTIMRLHICYQGQESFRLFTENGFTVVEIGGVIREV